MFEPSLSRWNLVPDGEPITTATSRLLPATQNGRKAMLKLATVEEEVAGGVLMKWWKGRGAARVLEDVEAAAPSTSG